MITLSVITLKAFHCNYKKPELNLLQAAVVIYSSILFPLKNNNMYVSIDDNSTEETLRQVKKYRRNTSGKLNTIAHNR
jgi:hypothetical protein